MNAHVDRSGLDPRRELNPDELGLASMLSAPQVGRPARGVDLVMMAGLLGALALGGITFLAMSNQPKPAKHVAASAPSAVLQPYRPVETSALALPQMDTPAAPEEDVAFAEAQPAVVVPKQSASSPLVIDNTVGAEGRATAPGGAAMQGGESPEETLTSDELFSLRVGGTGGTAHAQSLANPGYTLVQGGIIPAVLETAVNSDLPGYARAIVSRDVRGFDGSRVVVPRGSRLIGQYKSGLAKGQSRVFIVWSRLVRPDGVSIDLGSPVMDEAGQVGLGGKVNRHFLQRSGSALLLSVIGGVASALTGGAAGALVINTGADTQSAAAQAMQTDANVAPTIKVPLGTPIQVFAARDLDFSER